MKLPLDERGEPHCGVLVLAAGDRCGALATESLIAVQIVRRQRLFDPVQLFNWKQQSVLLSRDAGLEVLLVQT